MLAIEAGIAWWVAILASLLVVSGAAQFAWLGLVGAGVIPVLITTTGLALRHVPMSARMASLVGRAPLRARLALAWVLTDETFGLTLSAARRGEQDLVAYKAAVDIQLYSGWLAGTAIGVGVGSRLMGCCGGGHGGRCNLRRRCAPARCVADRCRGSSCRRGWGGDAG